MEQEVVFAEYQLWNFKGLVLFLFLILDLTSLLEDDIYSCLKLLF